jgi:TM2 domain-containing membrane protein YozV/RNA polymerase subunit RPABC4/transcription elongation factor Spt4
MGTEDRGFDTAGTGSDAYCISCGEMIDADANVCPSCGVGQDTLPTTGGEERTVDEKYCTSCGAILNADAEMCPECGVEQTVGAGGDKEKLVAGLLGILLGGLGAHKFYLGDTRMGVVYICFSWTLIPSIIGLIEGIIYLTKSDAEFQREYVDAE